MAVRFLTFLLLVLPATLALALAAEDERPRELRPLDAEAWTRRGFEYLARPRPEDQAEAERLFGKAIAAAPRAARPHAGLARAALYLYNLGVEETPARLATALEEARAAVEIDPRDAVARATLAYALAAADRFTPALEEARRAVEHDPLSAEAHLALGHVLRLRQETDGAVESCRRAAALAPHDPRVLAGLADALRDAGSYQAAMELYGQAVDLDHEALVPQLGAATTLQKMSHLTTARAAYRRLLEKWSYGTERIHLGMASMLVGLQDYDGALAVYERLALPANGSLPTLLALYGKAYCLRKLGRDAEAEYFLDLVIERVPRDYDGPARGREILFMAYDDLVRFFEARGRERRVEELLRSAVGRTLAPSRFAAALAKRLAARGAAAEGATLLARAVRGADRREDPLDLAESVLALARLDPASARRGGADGGGALAVARERIAASPLGPAHYRLARAQALAGLKEEALESLRRSRDLGYLPADQMAAEPDFSRLRGEPGFRDLLR